MPKGGSKTPVSGEKEAKKTPEKKSSEEKLEAIWRKQANLLEKVCLLMCEVLFYFIAL